MKGIGYKKKRRLKHDGTSSEAFVLIVLEYVVMGKGCICIGGFSRFRGVSEAKIVLVIGFFPLQFSTLPAEESL